MAGAAEEPQQGDDGDGVELDAQDGEGQTALHWAWMMGHEGLGRALLLGAGADATRRDAQGKLASSWLGEAEEEEEEEEERRRQQEEEQRQPGQQSGDAARAGKGGGTGAAGAGGGLPPPPRQGADLMPRLADRSAEFDPAEAAATTLEPPAALAFATRAAPATGLAAAHGVSERVSAPGRDVQAPAAASLGPVVVDKKRGACCCCSVM